MLCELSSAIADTLARYQHCFGHIPKTQHRTGSSERSQLHPSQTQYKCTNTLLNHLRTQTNACCIPQIQYEFQDPCSIEPVSLFILLCGSSRITSPSPDQSGRFLRATSALPLAYQPASPQVDNSYVPAGPFQHTICTFPLSSLFFY